MQLSEHTIIRKLKDSDEYYILNPLSKQADIIPPEMAQSLQNGDTPDKDQLIEKGYLVDAEEEKKRYHEAYLGFLDERDKGEIQIFFVPWYACNFNCSYCYQSGYDPEKMPLTKEVIDSFFTHVKTKFSGKQYYITVFGGEPLLPGKKQQAMMEYFIHKAEGIDLAFVTNGYAVDTYLPLLKQARIREIQFTLDGPELIHDKRRPLHDGTGTFSKIAKNIDTVINAGINVNLRAVVDRENINSLPQLADIAIERGWTKSGLFKTQLGRNYELHYCQDNNNKLFSRLSLFEEIYEMVKKNPRFLEFHKPAFSIARFLFENGDMPDPLFDSCPACKTEWAFDYTGRIYSCTATVGKAGEELGTFYPEPYEDEEKIEDWADRDVQAITKCKGCSIRLLCGGGCGAIAKNRDNTVLAPDCRPQAELLDLGLSLYFEGSVTDKSV